MQPVASYTTPSLPTGARSPALSFVLQTRLKLDKQWRVKKNTITGEKKNLPVKATHYYSYDHMDFKQSSQWIKVTGKDKINLHLPPHTGALLLPVALQGAG